MATAAQEDAALVSKLKMLEQRLEEMESSAAAREAGTYMASANWLFVAGVVALTSLAATRWGVALAVGVLAVVWVVFCCQWVVWRYSKAVWMALLILWKLSRSKAEAARLCDADGRKLLTARYRALAALAARGLRELGGVWPKVGQYLSTQGDQWPDEVLAELAKLRDAMPAAPFKTVRRTIERDLKRSMSDIFSAFDERPIASASIAQVHRAVLVDGRDVAVKVQHQHAARQIPWDVACMRLIGHVVWLVTLGEIDTQPVVNEWLGAVIEELDFQREVQNQLRGRAELQRAGVDVLVPEVFPSLCGRRVLVMEFIVGHEISAGDASLTNEERIAVMAALVRAYAVGLFVTGHFNGDPHAGNLLVSRSHPDGQPRCVLLDWGLTKTLSTERRQAVCQLMVATGMKDTCGIVQAFGRMGVAFSGAQDPEPDLLLAILRHVSLIDKQAASREITRKFHSALSGVEQHNKSLRGKIDSYTGDFFFVFRVATLIKGMCAILDIRAHFLDIFVEVSRDALRGPPPLPSPLSARIADRRGPRERQLAEASEQAIRAGDAVGVQVAVVAADGTLAFSIACGVVSYTSWQELVIADAFPLGTGAIARPLVAAAAMRSLRAHGFHGSAQVSSIWRKCPAPSGTTITRLVGGGNLVDAPEAWAKAPPAPSSRFVADAKELAAWLERAPRTTAGEPTPPWWLRVAHAASCNALLCTAGAGSLGSSIHELFTEARAGQALAAAAASPVWISKPVMSVDGAEVVAAQDALLASCGSAELQGMHLADPCLANHEALRRAEDMPCGLAAPAEAVALVAAHAHRKDLVPTWLLQSADDLACIRHSPRGETAVVLLTCANEPLARRLAEMALKSAT